MGSNAYTFKSFLGVESIRGGMVESNQPNVTSIATLQSSDSSFQRNCARLHRSVSDHMNQNYSLNQFRELCPGNRTAVARIIHHILSRNETTTSRSLSKSGLSLSLKTFGILL